MIRLVETDRFLLLADTKADQCFDAEKNDVTDNRRVNDGDDDGQSLDTELLSERFEFAETAQRADPDDCCEQGADETADLLGVSTQTVKIWRRRGLLLAHAYNDKNECLYEPPGDDPPVKKQGSRLSKRRRFPQVAPNPTKEVQCEA